MNNQYVYFHLRTDNRKVFYIGIGNKNRPFSFNPHHRNKNWNKIVNEIGKPIVVIIAKNISLEDAANAERFWINFFGIDTLANIASGGNGVFGFVHSEETRLKLSKLSKGRKHSDETKNKIRLSKLGKKLGPQSLEIRNKVSQSLKGHIISETTKRKISISLSGENHKDFDNTIYKFYHFMHGYIHVKRYDLCKEFEIDYSSMSKLLKGKAKSVKGWKLVK